MIHATLKLMTFVTRSSGIDDRYCGAGAKLRFYGIFMITAAVKSPDCVPGEFHTTSWIPSPCYCNDNVECAENLIISFSRASKMVHSCVEVYTSYRDNILEEFLALEHSLELEEGFGKEFEPKQPEKLSKSRWMQMS